MNISGGDLGREVGHRCAALESMFSARVRQTTVVLLSLLVVEVVVAAAAAAVVISSSSDWR